ncbi:MAG: type II toxin-antitoxin system VapC family toxin [Streptosporangiaceae bacterium]|jgi:predicted nucleic acid-binding protein
MIYLDTSAALKLVKPEPETAALNAWLAQRADVPKVSSRLLRIELHRAVLRGAPARLPQAQRLLMWIDLVSIDAVAGTAEVIGGTQLRSLDAIHLATAEHLQAGLSAFVAYDVRLASAASSLGLPVTAPA